MSLTEGLHPGYPPIAYRGEDGEASARVRRAGTPPEVTYRSGNTVELLATAADTGGLFGLYRWNFSPAETGPDPHFHRTMTETFVVLSGTVRLYQGQEWVDAGPGDVMHVPIGGVHGFRNTSGAQASMLLHFAPGAAREEYFTTLARLGAGLQMTDEERDAFYRAHDNIWL